MLKPQLAIEQKKVNIDLYIIVGFTIIILAILMSFQTQFYFLAKNKEVHILLRTLGMAFMQFGIAGFGIITIMILRKENFRSYGLKRKGALKSIIFSVLMFVPFAILSIFTGSLNGYLPFQSVWMTKELLASNFPINIVGMLLITISWGFFEGFNYVVISKKINTRFPTSNRWLNWGAIVCAIMCILIHGVIGITPESIIETVTVFIIIYGMLIVKEYTDNAWGSVFIFIFLWNAL
jgi:hypothetical protein